MELRRAMEALQVKLNRAEERLFGHDHSPKHRESDDGHAQSPLLYQYPQSPNENGNNRNSQLDEKEMEQLLQRFLSAEEEMKREQELLVALDRKQKLIEAQEQKVIIINGGKERCDLVSDFMWAEDRDRIGSN